MNGPTVSEKEAAARVLALLVAANGHVDERELATLDRLDAFGRLGIARERFMQMAQQCIDDVTGGLCERSWLHTSDLFYVNDLIDAVRDESLRLLVCRLSAAAITADGCITGDERLVYNHALARWHIAQDRVAHAILHDSMH